jgi:hypothetical protein
VNSKILYTVIAFLFSHGEVKYVLLELGNTDFVWCTNGQVLRSNK